MKDYNRLNQSFISEPKLTNLAIDFFTCSFYQKSDLFRDILKIFEEKYIEPKYSQKLFWIKSGRFSLDDFQYYVQKKKILGTRFPVGISNSVVETLLKQFVIIEMDRSFTGTTNILYFPNIEYVNILRENDLLQNLLFGYNYIVENYKSSIALIEIIDKSGDISLGTGFLISYKNLSIVITNKHVVEGANEIKTHLNGIAVKHNSIFKSIGADIAFIELMNCYNSPSFFLNPDLEVLKEIITMGYPSIPMTNDAYQVYHKGEINSFVQDYMGNDLFLFSSKTTSGNSGSPVIDIHGSVVGMVTKELFEEKALIEKGKLPYYAAIPSSKIISELELFF
jgi:hypothetical protein